MTENNRPRREKLFEHYNIDEISNSGSVDINSKDFNVDAYVQNAIKNNSLKQLLQEESMLVNDIQRLDSECQTLVYDHYDKFIAATDIVKQMKEGSAQMNAQVSELQENMSKITTSSQNITKDLRGRRGKMSSLLGIHSTLRKLQFLFHLPQKIDVCIKEKRFAEGVKNYVETCEVLQKYQHLASFSAIHKDCQNALQRLNLALKNELALNEGSARHLAQCVDLLLHLGEPTETLCDEFLLKARIKLEQDLENLKINPKAEGNSTNGENAETKPKNVAQTAKTKLKSSENLNKTDQLMKKDVLSETRKEKNEIISKTDNRNPFDITDGNSSSELSAQESNFDANNPFSEEISEDLSLKSVGEMDILEYMDFCHDTFVANLWLVISSYKEMFLRSKELENSDNLANEKLRQFVVDLVLKYTQVVKIRVDAEEDQHFDALANALDKFYRRIHAVSQLMANPVLVEESLRLIFETAESRCENSLQFLKDRFSLYLMDARQAIATRDDHHSLKETGDNLRDNRGSLKDVKETSKNNSENSDSLNKILSQIIPSFAADLKRQIEILLTFIEPKYTFATRSDFRYKFSRTFVREGVVVEFFKHIAATMQQFCDKKEKDPTLFLLLSRLCVDLHTSNLHYLLNHCDEQLQLDDKRGLTPYSNLTSNMKRIAQSLLDHYVKSQGASISQMLRRSVESKDWLGCSEPRNVRRVMKTVNDEIKAVDALVGSLYEEGSRKDRSSDSSRRTFHSASRVPVGSRSLGWSGYSHSNFDNSFVANLNKLWSEKIEIFAPVEFTRISVLTGVIKIGLKTLLESVRLQTFGRFGFQQVQVDIQYLRTYLWPYVADEQILNTLLDEVITSASLRSTDPELMENKIVEVICEQT